MANPDNKYCTECSYYNNFDPDFYEKYGNTGCSGIDHSSGEFPYECHPHCFSDVPLLTLEEQKVKAIKGIQKIIEENLPEIAAKLIYKLRR